MDSPGQKCWKPILQASVHSLAEVGRVEATGARIFSSTKAPRLCVVFGDENN